MTDSPLPEKKKNSESIYSSSKTVSVVLFLFFQKFLDVVDIFMHSMLQKAVSSSDTVTPRSNPIILDEKSTRMLTRPALPKRRQEIHKVL